MSYLDLLKQHGRFLGFGLTLTFLSSFGQTYFIALFNDSLRDAFGLSHSEIGSYYSIATLASGLTIAWLGQKLDQVDLRAFTAALCGALGLAALGMGFVPSVGVLVVVFFLLRLTGQGLLSHTALTSMSRYFDETRGKAMSFASLGYPLGEAILPILVVGLVGVVGWRGTWIGIGLAVGLVAIPFTQFLLRGHGERHREHVGGTLSGTAHRDARSPGPSQRQWSRSEVLRDLRFPLMLPAVTAPGLIVTGFFFHQNHLVATKAWSLQWFATSFAIFALGQLITGIAAGPLVDRFSGRRLMSVFTLPMAAGLTLLAVTDHAVVAAAFMLALGVTAGLQAPVVGSMWAELYGVRHLGAIRAMATSIMVFGTAASPALMGVLIDRGVTMEAMAGASALYAVLASWGVWVAMRVRVGSTV